VKDGEALSPTWVDAQVQRELIKAGGIENERCRGKLMEVLMMGNLLPTQWILYEAPVRSKALWHRQPWTQEHGL
jgi:hypothetical protein